MSEDNGLPLESSLVPSFARSLEVPVVEEQGSLEVPDVEEHDNYLPQISDFQETISHLF